MEHILSAHGLQNVVEGSRTCPVLTEASTAKDKVEVEIWNKDSAEVTRDESEDICAHVAKLQTLVVDLNDELQRNELTTLTIRYSTAEFCLI